MKSIIVQMCFLRSPNWIGPDSGTWTWSHSYLNTIRHVDSCDIVVIPDSCRTGILKRNADHHWNSGAQVKTSVTTTQGAALIRRSWQGQKKINCKSLWCSKCINFDSFRVVYHYCTVHNYIEFCLHKTSRTMLNHIQSKHLRMHYNRLCIS